MPFPDPTALLIAHIAPLVAPTPVASRVPNPRPAAFVQIRRGGGTATPPVRDSPAMDVLSWAPDQPTATATLATIRAAIWALPNVTDFGATVYRVEERLGPSQINDPDTGTPLCWMTVVIDIRADDAIQQFT